MQETVSRGASNRPSPVRPLVLKLHLGDHPAMWDLRARRLLWFFTMAIMVGLAGCSSSDDSPQSARISWTGVPLPIERMVDDYVHGRGVPPELRTSRFDPKYFIRPAPFFLFEGNDDSVTLALSARLGTSYPPVDIYFIDLYWFQDFERQWLTSFQSMTIPVEGKAALLRDVMPMTLRSGCELRGQLYAVPLSIRGNCLYYRTDLVSKAPRTWPELIEVASAVLAQRKKDSHLKHGIVFHWRELHNDLYPILWGYGGGPPSCLLPDGTLDQPLACDANLQALEMFYRLVRLSGIAPPMADLHSATFNEEKNLFEAFASGEALFLIDWTNRAARIATALSKSAPTRFTAAQIGIAPIPHGPDSVESYSTIGSWGWVVASDPRSAHSLELVRELASPGAQLYFFEKHAEIPIYRQPVLNALAAWPAAASRLTPYHANLLHLIHGGPDQPAVVLRSRPGRKEMNRLVLEALHTILELPPNSDPNAPFDATKAREILATADQKILQFLIRLQRLGVDCECDGADEPTHGPSGTVPSTGLPRKAGER